MGLWGHLKSGIESPELAELVKTDKLDKASQSYKLTEENTNISTESPKYEITRYLLMEKPSVYRLNQTEAI